MEHTPGPWYETKTAGNHQGLVISENTGETIALTYKITNALLIAAAPDLLEACKMVVRYVDEGIRVESEYSEMCREAISKAEGRG